MKATNRILYQEFRPYFGWVILIFILILLTVSFEAITPYPFKILIDNVLGSETLDKTSIPGRLLSFITSKESLGFFIILVYGLSSMFESISEYLTNLFNRKLSRKTTEEFTQRVYEALQKLGTSFYNKTEIGDYIYRLSYDTSAIGNILEFGLIPLTTNALYLVSTIIILFFINSELALISCFIIPILIVILLIFNNEIAIASKSSEKVNSALFSFIQEALSQMKIVQAFNQQKRFANKFRKMQANSLTEELKLDELNYLQDLLVGVAIALGYSIVILYGVKLVFSGQLSTGLLVVFVLYVDNLTYPLLNVINTAGSFREDYIKLSRMNDFFVSKYKIKDVGKIEKVSSANVVFDHVTVRGNNDAVLLKDASLTFPAGKTTVIVGGSGSGKTTLVSLLLRFVEPSSGKIFIGNTEIHDFSLAALREMIAYVPQEVILFDDTILNNVAFIGKPAPVDLQNAIQLASATEFIRAKQERFKYEVGPEGQNLSGGQRQRLLIARALLKRQAKIIVLDEPFSALDVKSRVRLMKNLEVFGKGKTVVIVSNVLETIQSADHVILVNEGEIMHVKDKAALFNQASLATLIQRN